MKKLLYKMAMFLMAVALFSGCDRELLIDFDGAQTPPSLMIKAVDANGNGVSGATVSIFNSLDGYITEQGAVTSGTTDGAGEVVFDAAALNNERGVYYFNVASGTLRNWTSVTSTAFLLMNDGQTTYTTTLAEVPAAFIALGANTWLNTSYLYPPSGTDVQPACEADDVLTFLKDGTLLRAEGASACASVSAFQAPISAAGSPWSKWTVSSDGASLFVRDLDPTYDAGACNGPEDAASGCPEAALTLTATTATIDYGGGYVAILTAN